jgi:hypothetical protein
VSWEGPRNGRKKEIREIKREESREGSREESREERRENSTGGIHWVPGLFGRTVSRVSQSKFTRKLFLRLAVLHIFL